MTNPFKSALGSKLSDKYTTNPLLKGVTPKAKPTEVRIRTTAPQRKQPMRQYGDKGYKPATGSGTGN